MVGRGIFILKTLHFFFLKFLRISNIDAWTDGRILENSLNSPNSKRFTPPARIPATRNQLLNDENRTSSDSFTLLVTQVAARWRPGWSTVIVLWTPLARSCSCHSPRNSGPMKVWTEAVVVTGLF